MKPRGNIVAQVNTEIGKLSWLMLQRSAEDSFKLWELREYSYEQLIDDMSRALHRVESERKRGKHADRKEIRGRLADCANAILRLMKEYEHDHENEPSVTPNGSVPTGRH